MYQYQSLEDTIVAISTPSGQGGIGIVRLSGGEAVSVCEKMFKGKKGKPVSQLKSHTVHYGWIQSGDEVVDEVLLTIMRAPKSYTKEDVIEISCHGGMVSLRAILQLAISHGARMAQPGEFTKRAFLNGRIDLAQAEAVLDIIHSKTEHFLKVSTHQLKGELSTELESIREELLKSYVEIEAIVNFPEDDIDASQREKIIEKIDVQKQRVEKLLASSQHGRILKEGIKIVLAGRPNVGKSSLLNVLLKTPRAIVSDIAGTTRDTIEELAQIQGIPFQLVDTAGILEPRDLIEEEAVKRSHMYIQGADLVLFVLDASSSVQQEDQMLMERVKDHNALVVFNKSDLKSQMTQADIKKYLPNKKMVKVSALKNEGFEQLESEILEAVWHDKHIDTHGIMISNERHIQSLRQVQSILEKSQRIFQEGISLEFVSEEIKQAVNYLDSITGRNVDADLLDTIFSKFCIGK